MPPQLLPASAAAFAPRASSVNVVLGSKVEQWLTLTLKRINRVKRPLNSVAQHQKCLTETLSSEAAIWTLASIMVPKAPKSELYRDLNPLVEALFNYQLITVEAYIVHVDMILRNEIAFKLTPDSIKALIQYHMNVHCVDAKANTDDWPEKEQQCKKMHADFVQAINKYVYRTHVTALEGLEEDGAGELLCGKSDEVKTSILGLFKRLQPPPPKVTENLRQSPMLPSDACSTIMSCPWTQQLVTGSLHPADTATVSNVTTAPYLSTLHSPADTWCELPPNFGGSAALIEPIDTIWDNMTLHEGQHNINSDIHSDIHGNVQLQQLFEVTPLSQSMQYGQLYSTAPIYYSAPLTTASTAQFQIPCTMLPQQCSVSIGYGSLGWDRYQEYTTMA
ncbi:hypothetical protein SEPCBS57363_004257 [Sporothrix epigloea]|uniref:Uncharacterized protein n=1 Tax=Sporothrix epigloea TaxID=1892477 RepID=A0ABP0DR54_9PEZI